MKQSGFYEQKQPMINNLFKYLRKAPKNSVFVASGAAAAAISALVVVASNRNPINSSLYSLLEAEEGVKRDREILVDRWVPPTRKDVISRLKASSAVEAEGAFDLLIIGGGATGVGCALDAATRGLKVAMVERDDFSSGKLLLIVFVGRVNNGRC